MRFQELVHEGPDLVKAQLSSRVWIEHGGMVDMLTLACQRGFDDQ